MIYVEDSDGSQWLSVVELLSERAAYDMVLCLYHGSTDDEFTEPFSARAEPESLERVTAYGDGSEPPCSARLPASEVLIDELRPHVGDFEDWGDSFVLYAPRERHWVAAFIPHERMVLVQDDQLQGFLKAGGITATLELPSGW